MKPRREMLFSITLEAASLKRATRCQGQRLWHPKLVLQEPPMTPLWQGSPKSPEARAVRSCLHHGQLQMKGFNWNQGLGASSET